MFSCFSVFVPFLSYLIGSKTIMWTWSSFIFCLSSASMGHLWRPSTTFPRLVPAFSDTGHHYFIILNTVIFFGIFAFVIHAFLNLVAQMLQQRRHMLATVSHEIRTPLHSICFNAKQLANQAGIQGTEEVHRLLSDVTHLVDLTNDVLDLTKMEEGAGEDAEPTLLPLSMIELGEALKTLIKGTAERQRLSGYVVPRVGLQVSYESIPGVVMLDRPRVLQTVLNFVSNAIKYAGALGDIEVSVKQAQSPPKTEWSEGYTEGKAAAAYLVFEVHDKGRLKGDPAQLFLPFETGFSERQLGGRSSLGLGLAICSLNARRMHGTVGHYYRGREKDTVFFLAVPLHEAAAGSVERNRQVLQSLREPGMYKILAVDDERVNLLILSKMLRDIGVHFETARTADEALTKLKSERFDVMLLDYQLGNGETGVDLVKRARQNGIELPQFGIVAVSAHALTRVRNECKDAGFADYLTKPFDSQSLTRVLMRVIEGANV